MLIYKKLTMERIPLYRAWNKRTNTMNHYVEIYCYKDGSVGYSAGENNGFAIGNTENFILMQFTGFVDKNDKKIFEGDICKSNKGIISFVAWGVHGWEMLSNSHVYSKISCGIEVIGNIYENKELLHSEKI